MQFARLENVGIMYAARKACTYIKKFKGRIGNSLDHNRIILLAIEVFHLFVHGYCFQWDMASLNCAYHLWKWRLLGE